jgi:histidinol-phosphate aminotransferase
MERYFKPAVAALAGYEPPPQEQMRAKLNQNESPFDLPEDFKKSILAEVAALAWNRYPVDGSPALRGALAGLHQLQAEQILLGNGSNQLPQTLLSAVIGPGDKVLLFPPTFGLFELFTTINGGEPLRMLCPPWESFNLEGALALIRQHAPRLVLICSPDNPTGAELSLAEIEAICQAAPGLVFLDEAYGEFSAQNGVPLVEKYPALIVSRTFSKAFSMAGLRLGYLMANARNIAQLRKANLPYNINLITEHIALRLLADPSLIQENVQWIRRERNWLAGEMAKIAAAAAGASDLGGAGGPAGFPGRAATVPGSLGGSKLRVYPSAANFILFRVPDGKALFRSLKDQGILVRDVSGYPLLQDHLRVNVGRHDENEWFLEALRRGL